MQREIKFRAWDGNEIGEVIALTMDDHVIVRDGTGVGARSVPIRKCTLMQFTGLHDKDGKEIYERDILRFVMNPYLKEAKNCIGKIEWSGRDCSYRISLSKTSYTFLTGDNKADRSYEIIGNMYQNPDLLTV